MKNDIIISFFLVLLCLVASCSKGTDGAMGSSSVVTEKMLLSGEGSENPVLWDFYCDKGENCGKWSKIEVPSNWELQGFGDYDYGMNGEKNSEQGIYRRNFEVSPHWRNKAVHIVFDGVMTDATVLVNNQQVGEKHQGGFYRFSYDITPYIQFENPNEIKVIVDKVSSNSSIEIAERQADYWVFGGIYRQVFLKALPKSHIDWVSLDAKGDGIFKLDVYKAGDGIEGVGHVEAQIFDLAGQSVGDVFTAPLKGDKASLSTYIDNPALWTAETPNLYQVNIQLKIGDNVIHMVDKTFGFRTFELRANDGLYLNGEKIILKGVNRHSFRPKTGRTTTPENSIEDIKLIKGMNMNAVRMSHYPPDVHFLEAADKLGIYVINELSTWQKPAYDTHTARRLVEQLVKRDQIHPSILIWANGNEGGWNAEVDDDFAKFDIQNRPVIHPWELFRHLDTDHYPTYNDLLAKPAQGEVFMPTEFLHGLYDGGHGAGLRDFWDFMMSSPLGAGGFLWVLADEGVVRTDQSGKIDTDGNHAPDGIVGPNGELEASYFTIREIWSPVQIRNLKNGQQLSEQFDGTLVVENLYDFIDLSKFELKWRLYESQTAFGGKNKLIVSGEAALPAVMPSQFGAVKLALPDNWQQHGRLEVELFDNRKNSIRSWAWPVQTAEEVARLTVEDFTAKSKVQHPRITQSDEKSLTASVGDLKIQFDATTGLLLQYAKKGQAGSLTNGPILLRSDDSLHDQKSQSWIINDPTQNDIRPTAKTQLKTQSLNGDLVIEVVNPPAGISKLIWTVHKQAYLSLEVDYYLNGEYVLHGIGFNYPKSEFSRKRWLGKGPYRVWANRLEGGDFSVWENEYNEGIAGENWVFPEFKGYFANIHWLTLASDNSQISFSSSSGNLFARVLQPENAMHPANTLALEYPSEISFLNRISPIGTKFNQPQNLGPQGQTVHEKGTRNIKLSIF